MFQKLILIACAGSLGSLARYGLAGLVQRNAGDVFPWGTLVVNLSGCFIAGFLWTLTENRITLGGDMRAVVFIGFFGAFTTFSTFMLETSALLRDGEWLPAAGNVMLHVIIGVLAVVIGMTIGRQI